MLTTSVDFFVDICRMKIVYENETDETKEPSPKDGAIRLRKKITEISEVGVAPDF